MFTCPECRLLTRSWLIAMLLTLFAILGYPVPLPVAAVLLILPVAASLRVLYSASELASLFVPLIILCFFSINIYAQICCAATYVFMILSVRSGRRWGASVSVIIIGVLFAKALTLPLAWVDVIYLICAALTVILNLPLVFYSLTSLKHIKIYSSDDKELRDALKIFTFSATADGVQIVDNLDDKNSGIVIAFKPQIFAAPYDILKNIKVRRGDKIFILYTAKLYPDMPYLLLWLFLTIKGAQVMGRAYVNAGYEKFMEEAGGDFAAGFKCGLPPLVAASPLFLVGILNFIKK